jgi:hypothetical protein
MQAAEQNRNVVALGSGKRTGLIGAEVLYRGVLHGWTSSRKTICLNTGTDRSLA